MRRAGGSGQVMTDDASIWDLSTSRDWFMLGGMILFHAMVGGISEQGSIDVNHRLILCAHTAQLAIFGSDLVELSVYGIMPSGIWYTGL